MPRHVRAPVRSTPRLPVPQTRPRQNRGPNGRLPYRPRNRRRHRPRDRGGVGDIQLELLGQGASRTTNLELVDAYDSDATELAETAGLRDRMTRRQIDIATTPDEVEAHDIVVLHRVVCCYPDYERLLTAAADHARRLLVFSHPPRNWMSWTFTRLQNVSFQLVGKSFRTFAHPPAAMVAVAEGRGMHTDYTDRGPVWQVVGLARDATASQ